MQWNSPKNTAKAGGAAGWSPQPMAATTGAGYRPMVSFEHLYRNVQLRSKNGQDLFITYISTFII